MDHLSGDDLRGWVANGDRAKRERVEAHLAACDSCGLRLRELLKSEGSDTALGLEIAPFREAGRNAIAGRSRRFAVVTVAATILVGVLVVFLAPRADAPSPDVLRGPALRALRPSGLQSEPVTRFAWTPSSRVVLEIYDGDQRLLYTTALEGASLDVDDELSSLLLEGGYSWMVTSLDARGGRGESSAMVAFTIAPP